MPVSFAQRSGAYMYVGQGHDSMDLLVSWLLYHDYGL